MTLLIGFALLSGIACVLVMAFMRGANRPHQGRGIGYCADCGSQINEDDDGAGVCIECGGRNRRFVHPCANCGDDAEMKIGGKWYCCRGCSWEDEA